MSSVNKPEQQKLFVCNLTNWPAKDDLASMDLPIFSLSKSGDTKIRNYVRGNRKTTIIPSAIGAATVFDKDLLLYAGSQVVAALNRGLPVSNRVVINSYDFLTSTDRGDGGASFDRIIDMLRRLNGTKIETNIPTGGTVETKSFGLIQDYTVLSHKNREVSDKNKKEVQRILSFEVVLSDWFMNALRAMEVLTIDRGYFKLVKPYEKRIYEIGRKHCGRQVMYKENIDDFAEKVGIQNTRFKVRSALKEIIKRDSLPEYHLALDESKKIDDVVIYTRDQVQLSRHIISNDLFSWFEKLHKH